MPPTCSMPAARHVAVAIGADRLHFLEMARLLALAPQSPPRARPVYRVAAFHRFLQGLPVHPGKHHHPAASASWAIAGIMPSPSHLSASSQNRLDRDRSLQAHFDAALVHVFLGLAHGVFAEVEDAGASTASARPSTRHRPDAAGCRRRRWRSPEYPRHRRRHASAPDRSRSWCRRDPCWSAGFRRRPALRPTRPFDGIQPGVVAAAMREHFPLARRHLLGVDGDDDALVADLAEASATRSGLLTAAVFMLTLSAPALSRRRTSATLRTPPPTVSGMKTCSAQASTMCRMMSR
jgi:hypothetical protein